jgi:hypothetical protein
MASTFLRFWQTRWNNFLWWSLSRKHVICNPCEQKIPWVSCYLSLSFRHSNSKESAERVQPYWTRYRVQYDAKVFALPHPVISWCISQNMCILEDWLKTWWLKKTLLLVKQQTLVTCYAAMPTKARWYLILIEQSWLGNEEVMYKLVWINFRCHPDVLNTQADNKYYEFQCFKIYSFYLNEQFY